MALAPPFSFYLMCRFVNSRWKFKSYWNISIVEIEMIEAIFISKCLDPCAIRLANTDDLIWNCLATFIQ